MLTILSSQRRRIAYFALTMSFGLLLIGLLPGLVWYTKLISLVFAPFVLAGVAAAVLAFAPSRRGWLECIGTGVMLGGGIGALTPLDGLIGLPLASLLSTGLVMLLHEGWADRLPLKLTFTSAAAGHLRADGAELWAAVVPGAGPQLVSERLIDVEPDKTDTSNSTFYAGLLASGELAEEVTLTLLEQDSSGTARIHIEGEDQMGRLSSGMLTLKVTEMDPDTSHLDMYETRDDMPPGEAIERWFDDVLGCEMRHLERHFLRLNPPEPAERSAEAAAGLPPQAEEQVDKLSAGRHAGMKDVARLPDDHLTLEAVRKAVS